MTKRNISFLIEIFYDNPDFKAVLLLPDWLELTHVSFLNFPVRSAGLACLDVLLTYVGQDITPSQITYVYQCIWAITCSQTRSLKELSCSCTCSSTCAVIIYCPRSNTFILIKTFYMFQRPWPKSYRVV